MKNYIMGSQTCNLHTYSFKKISIKTSSSENTKHEFLHITLKDMNTTWHEDM